ncbi:MAG: hypothetical protein ABEJ66_00700 [Candidatus Nanohaloarchaea archaeon]
METGNERGNSVLLKSRTDDFFRVLFFAAASLLIAVSAGAGVNYAFQSYLPGVFASLWVFVLGYKMAKLPIHADRISPASVRNYVESGRDLSKIDALSLVGGGAILSLSFVILAKSILQLSALLGANAAVLMGAGYVLMHWALNNTLV